MNPIRTTNSLTKVDVVTRSALHQCSSLYALRLAIFTDEVVLFDIYPSKRFLKSLT